MYYTIYSLLVYLYKIIIYIDWILDNEIKQKFTYFVFVLSKILVEKRQYTLQDRG